MIPQRRRRLPATRVLDDPRTVRRIDDLIGGSDALRRLSAAVARQRALLAAVTDAVPPDLAAHCVSATLEGTELRLLADSSAWATRLRYLGGDLRRRLRARWRVETVTVQVAPPRQPPPAGGRRAVLSATAADAIAGAAAGIEDAALRQALLRLSRHGRG